MRIREVLLLLSLCAGAAAGHAQVPRGDISIGGVGVFTLPSPGQFEYDNESVRDRITQSNRDGPGVSMECRYWWGNNAAGLQYSKSATNSRLVNAGGEWLNSIGQFEPWSVMTWLIRRDEVDVLYTRRLPGRGLRPYVTGGLGAEVLNGGTAGSGLDAQFAYIAGAGEDMRLPRGLGLRAGFTADSIRAPTYADVTYHSIRTWIFEPRISMTYSFNFGGLARLY